MRAAVAALLLAIFAAPAARAGTPLVHPPHSCCPDRRAQPPAPSLPCQQLAATPCCGELGVPPVQSPGAAVPALAVAGPPAELRPLARSLAPARTFARRRAQLPTPLALSGVLLL